MNHLVTLGFLLLLAALVIADGSHVLRATDIQNVMTVTNAPIVLRRREPFGRAVLKKVEQSPIEVAALPC